LEQTGGVAALARCAQARHPNGLRIDALDGSGLDW
jgi:hypothetical protein